MNGHKYQEVGSSEQQGVEQIQARLSGAPALLDQLLKNFDPESLHALTGLDLSFSLEHLPELPNIGAIDTLIDKIKDITALSLAEKREALANALAPLGTLLLGNHRALDRIDQNFNLKRKVIIELTGDLVLESALKLRNSHSEDHNTHWPPLFNELKMLKELKERIAGKQLSSDIEIARAIRDGLEPVDHKRLRLTPNKEIKKVLEALEAHESAEVIHSLQITKESVALLEALKQEISLRNNRQSFYDLVNRLKSDPVEVLRSYRSFSITSIAEAYGALNNQEKDVVILSLAHEIEQSMLNPFRFLWNRYLQDRICGLLKTEKDGLDTFKRCLVAISATSKRTDHKILQIIFATPIDNAELIHRLSDYSNEFPDEISIKVALEVLKRKQLISRLVDDPSEIAAAQDELFGSSR